MEACSEGAFVQQRVLVKLDLATSVALVQAHSAVGKVDHFPQDQLWSFKEKKENKMNVDNFALNTKCLTLIKHVEIHALNMYAYREVSFNTSKHNPTHTNREQALTVNPHYL